jgi:hypothetical protein
MVMKIFCIRFFIGSVLLSFTLNTHAVFIDAGNGMVYDTELNVTWLKDANLAMTSGYDADGLMNWNDAVAWASSLTVGGVMGWRLPTMTTSSGGGPRPNENGQDITGPTNSNEFGWLWYQLNGGADITASTDISPFINLPLQDGVSSEWYWTNEESGDNAWRMSMNCACWDDGSNKLTAEWYAWAVHEGNVTAVPETSTMLLMSAGLIVLGFVNRKRILG